MPSVDPPETAEPLVRPHLWLRHFLRESRPAGWPPGFRPEAPDDWDELLRCAQRHGLLPLLHARLKVGPDPAAIPPGVSEALQTAFLVNSTRNVLLLGELARLVGALSHAGIPVIVLKGAFLALAAYDHPGQRPMADLDLLLPRQRVMEAAAVLQTRGYSSMGGPVGGVEAYLDRHHHLPRLHKPPGLGVELHWTVVSPRAKLGIPIEGLWERSRKWDCAGFGGRSLAPEDLLLHLCVHASQGDGSCMGIGLRPLADVAAVTRAYERGMDWPTLVKRAREWGAARRVFLVLRLAVEWLDAGIPVGVLRELEPQGFDSRWLEEAGMLVMARGATDTSSGLRAARGGLQLLGGKRARWSGGRLPQIWRDLFPGREQWKDNPWVPAGTPFSAGNYLRHVWGRLAMGARFAGYLAANPRETWFQWRRLRREAGLGRWLDQPE